MEGKWLLLFKSYGKFYLRNITISLDQLQFNLNKTYSSDLYKAKDVFEKCLYHQKFASIVKGKEMDWLLLYHNNCYFCFNTLYFVLFYVPQKYQYINHVGNYYKTNFPTDSQGLTCVIDHPDSPLIFFKDPKNVLGSRQCVSTCPLQG